LHAVFEDTSTTPAVERRASELGAGLIIAAWEYERAEQIRGCCPLALADELEVTVHMVKAWRRHYEDRGHNSMTAERHYLRRRIAARQETA